MGPISGFRIVNLRVKNKAAYPDLGVDLGGDHVVIGLENGGGKSTLIGFLLHVIAPAMHMFLPRLAQRRQGKQGKEKLVEHYVPGKGGPTHVVLELDLPAPRGNGTQKVLIGSCLYWESGKAGGKVRELFWSARCVTEELTLTGLGLRGEGGRLLDHAEWDKWLGQMLVDHPDSEILRTRVQRDWEDHLANRLKVDVGFVKSWLLRMNQDEGAADHVFTFGSDRAFLDSLIEAVADPALIDGIKTELSARAVDADSLNTDRKRMTLLTELVTGAEPLANLAEQIRTIDGHRTTLVDAATVGLQQLQGAKNTVEKQVGLCQAKERIAAEKKAEAAAAHRTTQVQEVLARKQYAEIDVQSAEHDGADIAERITSLQAQQQHTAAAAIMAAQRSAENRIKEADRTLRSRTSDAEPLRRQAASAAMAWRSGLTDELTRVATDTERRQADLSSAKKAAGAAQRRRTLAIQNEGRSARDAEHAREELARLDHLVGQAIGNGHLAEGGEPAAALDGVRRRLQALRAEHSKVSDDAEGQQKTIDVLNGRLRTVGGRVASAQAEVNAAQEGVNRITQATVELQAAVAEADLLDDPGILLEDNAELVDELLAAVAQSAHGRQLDIAVRAAAQRRASKSLEDTDLLPPRADVAMLCEQATAAGLGVRPGWSFLSLLEPEVAASFAAAHPALADGIVVTVPEDLHEVVDLVSAARLQLTGPIAAGLATAFHELGSDSTIEIILPEDAYWSKEAGKHAAAGWQEAHQRSENEAATCQRQYRAAIALRTRLAEWTAQIGPGAQGKAEAVLAALHEELAADSALLAELEQQIADHREQRSQAAERARNLTKDIGQLQPAEAALAILLDRLEDRPRHQASLRDAEQARDRYGRDKTAAATELSRATSSQNSAGVALSSLLVQETELKGTLREAATACAAVVRDGDAVAAEDASIDRASLGDIATARVQAWNGSIAEPDLRAAISAGKSQVSEAQRKLKSFDATALRDAAELVTSDPTRTQEDFERDSASTAAQQSDLRQQSAALENELDHKRRNVESIDEEYRRLGNRSARAAGYVTTDLSAATAIAAELASALADTLHKLKECSQASERATEELHNHRCRADALERCHERLDTIVVTKLSGHSTFMERLDGGSRSFELDSDRVLAEAPPAFQALLDQTVNNPGEADPYAAAQSHLEEITDEADHIDRQRASTETLAAAQLAKIEAILRNADHEAVTGDKLLLTMRALDSSAQYARVAENLVQARSRLTAVADDVAKFDKKLENSAKTVFTSLQHILRDVTQTVQVSELPSTPAMGRWAGQPLLKLSNLHKLNKTEKYAAVLVNLRAWYDPDTTGKRPELSSNNIIFTLVEAMTPGFRAKVLVPSDPLDPEHKPIDELAKETSGGEGVTFALILASLLAARRAAHNGHQRTTLILDNPFSKLTKPTFLRLVRDVATSLGVQIVALTGIKDAGALTVFPTLVQLRLSRRKNANLVVPEGTDDAQLSALLHDGLLYVSATERDAAADEDDGNESAFPTTSQARVSRQGDDAATAAGLADE